ncbi:MAG: ribbon-helix-helix domain-containing protein [Rhizobiaceae bacterium]
MSTVRKRSVSIGGHRTSYSIEDAFQAELNTIAETRGISLAALIAEIDAERDSETNLSSALRLFVLNELKRARQLAPKNILQFQ